MPIHQNFPLSKFCAIWYSPVADLSMLVTRTVISVDDGLLRTSVGRDGPSFSLTLYVDRLNLTVMAIE